MQVTLNGDSRVLDRELTVEELLANLALAPGRVAVELNQQLVRRTDFARTPVRNGDQIEIVTLVGGG